MKSLFEYNADDLIREQCRAREEAERHERTLLKKIADQEKLNLSRPIGRLF